MFIHPNYFIHNVYALSYRKKKLEILKMSLNFYFIHILNVLTHQTQQIFPKVCIQLNQSVCPLCNFCNFIQLKTKFAICFSRLTK